MASKVIYNQKGYVGSSMSRRAAAAYEGGEMPKSRWTKGAMLSAMMAWCDDNDRALSDEITSMRRDNIFERFFIVTSWHHTGRFAAATDFYGIDESALLAATRRIDERDLESRAAEREAERARREAEREAEGAAEDETWKALGHAGKYIAARNPAFTHKSSIIMTMAAQEALHPERFVTRVAKSGRVMLRDKASGVEVAIEQAYTYKARR